MSSPLLRFIALGLLIICYSSYLSSPLMAQSIEEKYQFLRNRFLDKFVEIGEGTGYSLPAGILDLDFHEIKFNKDNPEAKGMLRWTDATFMLGDYLGVLATEYAINTRSNSSSKDLIREIYYALKAYRRLDAVAEHHLYNIDLKNHVYERNGFFLRDDISAEFVEKNFSVQCDGSDFIWKAKHANVVSQDQIIGLSMGLSLIIFCLPESVSYNNMSLNKEAKDILNLLTSYAAKHNWILKTPIKNNKVPAGFNMKYQSYPLCELTKRFTGNNYHDNKSKGLGRSIWKFAQKPFAKHASAFIKQSSHGEWKRSIYNDINNSMMLKLAALSNTWDTDKLYKNCIAAKMEVFILLHQFIHKDIARYKDQSLFQKILEAMPATGPYCVNQNNKACCEWASRDRWNHPIERLGFERTGFKGYFVGLDYMLLYNLYILNYKI